jgi:toxin-antitoxin system PIN domain toxin
MGQRSDALSVIAVDTNILVYAHREDSTFHAAAYRCVAGLAEGRSSWGVPWPCLHEFFSIVTHSRIYKPPTPLTNAIEQIDAWLASPSVVLLGETTAHWPQLRQLLTAGCTTGPAVHDARIAALCLQHGVACLWTADRDFGRFPALKTLNPLISTVV